MLLVNIALVDSDWISYRSSIARSLGNFHRACGNDVFFYFVLQTRSNAKVDAADLGVPASQVGACYVDQFSVSGARNRGIEFGKQRGFDSIVFHDASIVYLRRACAFFRDHYRSGLLRCGHSFETLEPSGEEHNDDSYVARRSRIGRAGGTYVWTYCFPLTELAARFDERFGPGESSRFKCGEDVLFIRACLAEGRVESVLEMPLVGVVHPPRPADFSKHLAYAYGQGKLHQLALRNDLGPVALINFIAFLGNAVFRAILFRRNALAILRLRIAGLFSSDD